MRAGRRPGAGQIRLADARALTAALDTGEEWDPVVGGIRLPTRSSVELAGLQRLLMWARAAGLLRTGGVRLEQTPLGTRAVAGPGAVRQALLPHLR